MSDGLTYNQKTADWLNRQGFEVTPEDQLGLDEKRDKPDFLCKKDNSDFWVEVKSISTPDRIGFQGWCFDEFRCRAKKEKTFGRVFVTVADETSEKDIKIAVSMVSRVLSGKILSPTENAKHYVMIPKDPVPSYNEFIQLEYETSEGKEVLHAVRSLSEKYSRSYLGNILEMGAKVKITYSSDRNNHLKGNLLDWGLFDDANFCISIQLMAGEDKLRICSLSHAIGMEKSPNIETLRNRSSKAKNQFKSASNQKGEKSAVVIFHQDNVFASSDDTFLSAFYGDLSYEWSVDEGENRKLFYGRHGFWNDTQNTTVSAAVYFRKDERPIIVYNLWAKNPLPKSLLDCKEFIPDDNGSFTICG